MAEKPTTHEFTVDTPLATLLSSLARIPLFMIHMVPTAQFAATPGAERQEILRQHLRFLAELDRRGILFASGPLDRDTSGDVIEGMSIIAAPSRDAAAQIMAEEPFARAGMRTNTVRSWSLNEGASVPTARDLVEAG